MLIFIFSILNFIALLLFIYFESIDFLIIYILLRVIVFVLEYEEEHRELTEEDLEELYAEIEKIS